MFFKSCHPHYVKLNSDKFSSKLDVVKYMKAISAGCRSGCRIGWTSLSHFDGEVNNILWSTYNEDCGYFFLQNFNILSTKTAWLLVQFWTVSHSLSLLIPLAALLLIFVASPFYHRSWANKTASYILGLPIGVQKDLQFLSRELGYEGML